MTTRASLSRRRFLQTIALAPLAARTSLAGAMNAGAHTAYIGVAGRGAEGQILVFSVEKTGWTLKQIVPCAAPVSLALHPCLQNLYAVNGVDCHAGLPCGTVEAYSIDEDGKISLIHRRALSLSATYPRHLAISPDGRRAVVSIHGGGSYNLLPIGVDGRLGPVTGILKETGCGADASEQRTALPMMATFDTTGRHLLSVDQGTDRLNVFSVEEDQLSAKGRHTLETGSEPNQIVMHPSGRFFYVSGASGRSLRGYEYDAASGRITGRFEQVVEDCVGAMAMHPTDDLLYTAHDNFGIRGWKLNASSGMLTPMQDLPTAFGKVIAMIFESDGSGLIALSEKQKSMVRIPVNLSSGKLGRPASMAEICNPLSIAIS